LNTGSAPGGIWSGSDGNVWFTDQATSRTTPRSGESVAATDAADSCTELVAFTNQVHAQSGKKLTNEQAASLLHRAEGIETALGC
jgi:streptogramin lyase